MHPKRTIAALLLLSSMGLACPGSDSTGPTGTASIVGTWSLQSVDGTALPAPMTQDGETLTVTGGSATVNANGTFTWSETYTAGSDGVTGTWSAAVAANTYVFDPTETIEEPHQDNATAVVSGNTMTLTIQNGSTVRVYTKQ